MGAAQEKRLVHKKSEQTSRRGVLAKESSVFGEGHLNSFLEAPAHRTLSAQDHKQGRSRQQLYRPSTPQKLPTLFQTTPIRVFQGTKTR